MDLDADGKVDILSGSYSRHSQPMAGLFQVLWGKPGRSFEEAAPLQGANGEPLVIPATEKNITDAICTRPTAVDLDADGDLDLVSGNFSGTFALFTGKGKGQFAPEPSWLMASGARLAVQAHSDPFFVDWEGDGDLDLVSGSAQGGVFLCRNQGSAKQAKFARPVAILEAVGYSTGTRLGDAHVTQPQIATRVFVDDLDGDGKFDILIGDNITILHPAKGLSKKEAREKLAAWAERWKAIAASRQTGELSAAEREKLQEQTRAVYEQREEIVRTERTGFVWVMYQKRAASKPNR